MTPEDYEEAATAGAEFSLTKGEKNSQSHKTTAKLKTSASNKRDSNGHPLKGIETRLPEPQYRTVAGHVSRRANTSASADPPPPPAPIRATSSNQRRERRKKTDGGGLGDDSDDSDSGDQKLGQGNDTPSASSRQKQPQPQNAPEPTSTGVSSRPFESLQSKPLQFSREEQERLDLRHELSITSSIWENTIPLRNQNSKQATGRQTKLATYLLRINGLPRRFPCQDYDKRFDEYLEQSLHRAAIEGTTQNFRMVMQLTHRFIHELEQEVVRRREEVSHAQDAESPSHLQGETTKAVLLLAAHMQSDPAIEKTTSLEDGTWSDAVNIFAKALIGKMMRCAGKGLGYVNGAPINTLSANTSGEERTRFFLLNRKRHGITNAYMEWLCEDVDIDSIQECPVELLNGLRAMQRLKTLREGTQQIFICQSENVHGISSPRVSLVMFKGNQPLRTQTVSPDELSRMGWIRDTHTPSFWRSSSFEAHSEGEQSARKAVFKVDMDGAVLAIQRSDGQWLDWKDIEGRE